MTPALAHYAELLGLLEAYQAAGQDAQCDDLYDALDEAWLQLTPEEAALWDPPQKA